MIIPPAPPEHRKLTLTPIHVLIILIHALAQLCHLILTRVLPFQRLGREYRRRVQKLAVVPKWHLALRVLDVRVQPGCLDALEGRVGELCPDAECQARHQ